MTGQAQSGGVDTRHSLVLRLVDLMPWWKDVWLDHERGYGPQAPGAFLSTVALMCSNRLAAGGPTDDLPVDETLAFLESAFGSDADTDSFIAGSFLGKLRGAEGIKIDPATRLGPKLRAELERHRAGGGIPVPTPGLDFVNDLSTKHPAVAAAMRGHLEDWDGELSPYIFMGDLVLTATHWLDTTDGRATVVSVLSDLENAYGHDYELDGLIALGFVDALPYPDEAGADLLTMLGPKLRAEHNIQHPAHQIPASD